METSSPTPPPPEQKSPSPEPVRDDLFVQPDSDPSWNYQQPQTKRTGPRASYTVLSFGLIKTEKQALWVAVLLLFISVAIISWTLYRQNQRLNRSYTTTAPIPS